MIRVAKWSALATGLALWVSAVGADVKTTQVDSFSFEGAFGGFINRFSGGAKDGISSTVAVHGGRMAKVDDRTGQIIDLEEERVYELDMRKKEYRVRTFAEIREQFEKARADAEKRMQDMKPEEKAQLEQAGQQLEFDVDVQDTNEAKEILGRSARHVVLVITGRQKGTTLEEGGGFVMTSDMWLVPSIPELNEIVDFQLKFAQAVYGENFLGDMQQMAGMMTMFPSFGEMAERMQVEGRKLEGTPVLTTATFESVKSAEQMKASQAQQPSGGGGFGGALARRVMGNRGEPQARSKAFTSTHEVQSVSTSASEADVAIPAGFKEKN